MNWAWIGHQGDYDRRTAIHIAAAEGNKEAPRKFVELGTGMRCNMVQ